ncbi:MAG: hypothetical protein M1818_006321 [Claussenomyces sp. TS43310]|nr:MAG: hypothetical protein M1818_006321 [Claussenomyces sp. TS43310]
MGETTPPEDHGTPAFEGLRSARSTSRLHLIDHLRATGVGNHIPLQIVVCGDRSTGKSSVLEGVFEIPLSRGCTKFAIEFIIRHSLNTSRITATVKPHKHRASSEKNRLRTYRRELDGFLELPSVISEAAALIGIRGYGDGESAGSPAFAADILRIEVVGNTGLHLTVVDLPGIIGVAGEEQTEKDVELVNQLVDSYLKNSRTIILAVVQASNDIANQRVIQRARNFDKVGQRTIGIITKPDLINEGTQGRIASMARNEDTTKLKLGYFLLKNPTSIHIEAGISLGKWRQLEHNFFSSGSWQEHHLDMSRVGIEALTTFLRDLLDKHIEKQLPKVRKGIQKWLDISQKDLDALGGARSFVGDIRMFFTRLSTAFHGIAQAALHGNYHDLLRIASEPSRQKERRVALTNLVQSLKGSLVDLQD